MRVDMVVTTKYRAWLVYLRAARSLQLFKQKHHDSDGGTVLVHSGPRRLP